MKKKTILALLTALVMTLGLVVPFFASSYEENHLDYCIVNCCESWVPNHFIRIYDAYGEFILASSHEEKQLESWVSNLLIRIYGEYGELLLKAIVYDVDDYDSVDIICAIFELLTEKFYAEVYQNRIVNTPYKAKYISFGIGPHRIGLYDDSGALMFETTAYSHYEGVSSEDFIKVLFYKLSAGIYPGVLPHGLLCLINGCIWGSHTLILISSAGPCNNFCYTRTYNIYRHCVNCSNSKRVDTSTFQPSHNWQLGSGGSWCRNCGKSIFNWGRAGEIVPKDEDEVKNNFVISD